MGTNYYMASKPRCKECGHKEPARHIGKSSVGWVFALHVYPDEGINDLEDWMPLLAEAPEIRDEYDALVTPAEMLSIIKNRKWREPWPKQEPPVMYSDWDDFHAKNSSIEGPHGLLRAKPDGRHCLKNGAGTWDCHVGDFS